MRQVINGKVYDTEKATLIAEDGYGNPSDLHWWHEALYRTAKGNCSCLGKEVRARNTSGRWSPTAGAEAGGSSP